MSDELEGNKELGVELQEYISAGYTITQAIDRPEWMSADLLPASILSLSDCISGFIPNWWTFKWATATNDKRRMEAERLGIGADNIPSIMQIVEDQEANKSIGWPNILFALESVQRYLSVLPRNNKWRILGLSLQKNSADIYLKDCIPGDNIAEWGVYSRLRKGQAPESGGVLLGYELLGWENSGNAHSWLCNNLETECHEKCGVRPSANGFIGNLDDAIRCAQYISKPEVGAEPGVWQPWLIIDYSKIIPD
jgi:hypothetical protein